MNDMPKNSGRRKRDSTDGEGLARPSDEPAPPENDRDSGEPGQSQDTDTCREVPPSDDGPPVALPELEELKKALDDRGRLAEEYLTRLKYLQAEFDNYKKWAEKDRAEFTKVANERLIRQLLPVIDTLEKALDMSKTEKSAFRDGVVLIYGELMNALKGSGLAEMSAKGSKFDPFRHEAMIVELREDIEDGTVLEELQKGYMLNDKVIRTAKVKIAKKPENAGSDDGSAPPRDAAPKNN
jgi:molecular chaperone GrpE